MRFQWVLFVFIIPLAISESQFKPVAMRHLDVLEFNSALPALSKRGELRMQIECVQGSNCTQVAFVRCRNINSRKIHGSWTCTLLNPTDGRYSYSYKVRCESWADAHDGTVVDGSCRVFVTSRPVTDDVVVAILLIGFFVVVMVFAIIEFVRRVKEKGFVKAIVDPSVDDGYWSDGGDWDCDDGGCDGDSD